MSDWCTKASFSSPSMEMKPKPLSALKAAEGRKGRLVKGWVHTVPGTWRALRDAMRETELHSLEHFALACLVVLGQCRGRARGA